MNHIDHKECRRTAIRTIESISYKLYTLKVMALDGCFTTPYLKDIEKLENDISTLRQVMKYGKSLKAKQ